MSHLAAFHAFFQVKSEILPPLHRPRRLAYFFFEKVKIFCFLVFTFSLFQLLCRVVGGKVKKPGKRGRKPAKIDLKAKLERSRQSARECRARKKLRYQYLEELVSSRERAICALREELEMYKQWCMAMDQGKIPSEIKALLTGEEQSKVQQNSTKLSKVVKTEANSNNPW
uniref:cAMP-responsive element-binding protein-like 2 n=1 Tax=Crocodylus porosus TaxID=8502 RepID=A0A7M4FRB1_CROPO